MKEQNQKINIVEEPQQGFAHISEEQKLVLEMKKPAIEKLQSFTRMLRRNAALQSGSK